MEMIHNLQWPSFICFYLVFGLYIVLKNWWLILHTQSSLSLLLQRNYALMSNLCSLITVEPAFTLISFVATFTQNIWNIQKWEIIVQVSECFVIVSECCVCVCVLWGLFECFTGFMATLLTEWPASVSQCKSRQGLCTTRTLDWRDDGGDGYHHTPLRLSLSLYKWLKGAACSAMKWALQWLVSGTWVEQNFVLFFYLWTFAHTGFVFSHFSACSQSHCFGVLRQCDWLLS